MSEALQRRNHSRTNQGITEMTTSAGMNMAAPMRGAATDDMASIAMAMKPLPLNQKARNTRPTSFATRIMRHHGMVCCALVAGTLLGLAPAWAQRQPQAANPVELFSNGYPVGTSANPIVTAGGGVVSLGQGANKIGTLQPATYSSAITFASSVGTSSEALISGGGAPTGRLDLFNNGTTGTVWVNPSGGQAVVGSGIPIYPRGSYLWANGLSVVPTGISDNGVVAISGAGGY